MYKLKAKGPVLMKEGAAVQKRGNKLGKENERKQGDTNQPEINKNFLWN